MESKAGGEKIWLKYRTYEVLKPPNGTRSF